MGHRKDNLSTVAHQNKHPQPITNSPPNHFQLHRSLTRPLHVDSDPASDIGNVPNPTHAYSDDNLGEVSYTSENYYVANFFTDEGGVSQSGLEVDTATESVAGAPDGYIPLAVIDNVTS